MECRGTPFLAGNLTRSGSFSYILRFFPKWWAWQDKIYIEGNVLKIKFCTRLCKYVSPKILVFASTRPKVEDVDEPDEENGTPP